MTKDTTWSDIADTISYGEKTIGNAIQIMAEKSEYKFTKSAFVLKLTDMLIPEAFNYDNRKEYLSLEKLMKSRVDLFCPDYAKNRKAYLRSVK